MTTTLIAIEAAQLKAAERVKTDRVLEFYAAAFTPGQPDSAGDVIDAKAFDAWLPEFYAKGQALRISFNHAAVLDPTDPTNTVGYAPADPAHVWVDDYGLRVKAFLDVTSEKGRAVEYQVEKGLLTGASLAYLWEPQDRIKTGKFYTLKRIRRVTEAGLVPNPANQAAVLLWLKSEGALEEDAELPYMTVAEFREVVKGEPEGEDLEEVDPDPPLEDTDVAAVEEGLHALKHAGAASHIQKAHDALVRSGAKCESVGEVVAEGMASEETEFVTKLRLIEASLP